MSLGGCMRATNVTEKNKAAAAITAAGRRINVAAPEPSACARSTCSAEFHACSFLRLVGGALSAATAVPSADSLRFLDSGCCAELLSSACGLFLEAVAPSATGSAEQGSANFTAVRDTIKQTW